MTADVFEWCPRALQNATMVDGKCLFCGTAHPLVDRLSPTQKRAVKLLADGLTGKEVAARVGSKYNTVFGWIRDARMLVGARTTEQMMVMLAREGSL